MERRQVMDTSWQSKIKQLNRRRWVVWFPLAFAFLAVYFHRTATGVVADQLMRDFSIVRATQIGGLASIYFYTYAVMQIPSGILADFYGPRRTIFLALIIAGIGAVFFGLAKSIKVLYIGRFLSSFGVSLLYVNIAKIHAEWFRTREFATITGLLVVAGSAGFLLASTPLALMVDWFGWRLSFMAIAGYSLLATFFCWLLVRDKPENVGLPSIAKVEAEEGTVLELAPVDRYSIWEGLKIVAGNSCTWWPFLASVSIYGVYMAFMGLWAVPYFMQVYGMARVEASNHIMAMAMGTMIGSPLIGFLSDHFHYRRGPYILTSVGFLAIWLLFTVWNGGKPPIGAWYPLCFAIGLGMSGVNLSVACGKEVNPPQMTGIVAGIVNSGSFIGAGLMQPLFGYFLDRHWQGIVEKGVRVYSLPAYQSAFWFCTAILGVGFLFTLLIKETKGVNINLYKR